MIRLGELLVILLLIALSVVGMFAGYSYRSNQRLMRKLYKEKEEDEL